MTAGESAVSENSLPKLKPGMRMSVDLVAAARKHVSFLKTVHHSSWLHQTGFLSRAIRRSFLFLLFVRSKLGQQYWTANTIGLSLSIPFLMCICIYILPQVSSTMDASVCSDIRFLPAGSSSCGCAVYLVLPHLESCIFLHRRLVTPKIQRPIRC